MRGIPQQLIQNGRCYSDETGIAGINTRIKMCESIDQPQHCFDYPYVLAAGACENDMCVCVCFHVQGVLAVGGEDASVVCSHFGNKILICISHYQKFGTLVSICTSTQFEQSTDLHLYPACIRAKYYPTPCDSLENR